MIETNKKYIQVSFFYSLVPSSKFLSVIPTQIGGLLKQYFKSSVSSPTEFFINFNV
jgi:hypothetical protein